MPNHMLFVDWQSTDYHACFNNAIFNSFGSKNNDLIVFSKKLLLASQNSTYIKSSKNRIKRALRIFVLCWKHRKRPIFFLTYDPLFIVPLQLFLKIIYTYEHNTTPEKSRKNKHALFQKLFYWSIIRFTQYPTQTKILKTLNQKCRYAGSPLEISSQEIRREDLSLYIVPSDRIEESEIKKLEDFAGNSDVILRSKRFSNEQLEDLKQKLNIVPVDWIDLDRCLKHAKGIVITISSQTRGSGWFNESIKYGIPIVITNESVQELFEMTFPDYPYLKAQQGLDDQKLEKHIQDINYEFRSKYIIQHNKRIKERILKAIR